jgi:hypothetical protein
MTRFCLGRGTSSLWNLAQVVSRHPPQRNFPHMNDESLGSRGIDRFLQIVAIILFVIFAVIVYGHVFSNGLCCADDSMYATVAKNLAFGKGYVQSTPLDGSIGLRPFDPGVGTGPTVIIPTAALIYVVGNVPWAPGFATATISFLLLLFLAFILLRNTSGAGAYVCTSILLLYSLTAGIHFEHWYSMLGETPAALLCIAGAGVLATHPERRSSIVVASVLYGLALMTKLLSLLAFIPIAVWLVFKAMRSRNRSRHLVNCVFGAIAFATPFALFELWKLRVLGLHLYRLNTMEFLGFFSAQSTAANGGLGKVTAVMANALKTYSNNSAVMQQRFGYSPVVLLLVAALALFLLWRHADSDFIKLFFVFAATGALFEISWWLFISIGWPRYALIGLFLYFFAVSCVVFIRQSWLITTVITVQLLVIFSPGYARFSDPIRFVLKYRYAYTPRLVNLLRTVRFLENAPHEQPFVMGLWSTAGDIEYAMPTVGNFIRYDHVPEDRQSGAILVRNKIWVDFGPMPEFTAWEQKCDETLWDAPPYVVSHCPQKRK